MYTVRLENTVTHQIYEQQVEDTNDGGKLYFRFGISTIDLADGEYILTVFGENGDVLAEDLLRIGDFNPQTLQYTKGEKTYLDITVDAILQREKNVSITDIHTRILPDLGNDAVEIVYVDAQPLYDSAYNSGYENGYNEGFENSSYTTGYDDGYTTGYESGYTTGYESGSTDGFNQGFVDGVNEQKNKLEQITVTENGIYEKEDGYNKVTVDIDLDTPYNNGYGDGYKDGTDDFIGKLTDLTVTENGIYKTKYSEGDDFATGDNFYDYASLHNKVYNTNMYFHKDLSFDVWFRITAEIPNDDLSADIDILSILGTENKEYSGFPLRLQFSTIGGGKEYHFTLRYGNYYFVLPNISVYEWAHIKVDSSTREVSVNGVPYTQIYLVVEDETETDGERFVPVDEWGEVEDVVSDLPITLGFVNNAEDVPPVGITTAFEDVDLGMVIIDGAKFIPTPNGYKRVNTDEYLEEIPVYIANGEDISYVFHNIEVVSVLEEGAYKTVYVNVPNDSFDKGYEQGQKDIAENARVLEVTENGFYDSKFSEIPKPDFVTGVYPDGTEFYNFAELRDIVYNTGIKVSENTKVEIWYKPRDLGFISWGGIIGTIEDNTSNAFGLFTRNDKASFVGRIGGIEYYYKTYERNKWFHLELSFADGFVVDGVNYGTYRNNTGNLGRYLFINDYDTKGDGYFGMIKIDDTIIIPTEEGFLNTNTGTLLEVVEEGTHTFTNNTPKVPEGELYKTVNVNVVPKINLAKEYLKFGYSTFVEVPKWADFENLTDTSNLFYSCKNLENIELFDTKFVNDADSMFMYCSKLKNLPNNFNFSGCTNLEKMFYGASSLNDYTFLETWIINPLANMNQMIDNRNTTYVPAIPCVGNSSYYESAIFYSSGEYSQLTYFGGWIGRKYKVTKDQCLKKMPNLTRESCISILNNLYDFTGNGETPNSSQGQLKVHQNFINNVGDDITIGTNKGWTITT